MKKLILFILCFVLLAPSLAVAQDDTIECEPDLEAVKALLDEADTALEDGDTETALALMNEAQNELGLAQAECSGLVFADDAAKVFGPVFIEEGIYRARVVTEKSFSLQLTVLEGECGQGNYLSPLVFNFASTESESEETVFTVNEGGCEVLLETSIVSNEYTLSFEKIR